MEKLTEEVFINRAKAFFYEVGGVTFRLTIPQSRPMTRGSYSWRVPQRGGS
jgi:hypothetical protein